LNIKLILFILIRTYKNNLERCYLSLLGNNNVN
jgi:hypothetical protein